MKPTKASQPCTYSFPVSLSLLCEEFADQIRTQLGIPIYSQPKQLLEIITILFEYAEQNPLTLILDEFQDVSRVNASFFSDLQNLRDQFRPRCKLQPYLLWFVVFIDDAYFPRQ